MADDDAFTASRNRAYELADTGRYADWASLSAALAEALERLALPLPAARPDRG
jgi:hypothetical protein